jgi:hypothetical protein
MPSVDEMWQGARDAVTVKRVFGKPVEGDRVTVIPVAAVRGGAGRTAEEASASPHARSARTCSETER